jgi:4-amino-4-deoxy-L-arabinose transferase-like glycosyltransferase
MGSMRWLISGSVLGLALVLVFYQLGDGSLYDWDEAIYAQSAKEMLLSGVWGTVSWNGSPFFHKPPLYFWLIALTYQLLGVSEFAARCWSAVLGWGVVVLTFVLGARFHSWAVGAGAALLLLGVDQSAYSHKFNFLSQARVGMLDIPLTFWIVAAQVLIWEAGQRPWVIACIGLPAGLAVMTKAWPGLFALVIPLAYWLLTRPRHARQPGYWIIAGACTGNIILPWHLWQSWTHGSLFLQDYVGVNLLGRLSKIIEEHDEGPLFYLDIVRRGFSLWGYVWLLAYGWGVRQAWHHGDRRMWLLLSWVTGPLVLFSMAQTKLGNYINMIYPAIALLIGLALTELLTARVAFGVIAAVMAVCCIRLPGAVDGSPAVKPVAAYVAEHLGPDAVIYVVERECRLSGPSPPQAVPANPGQDVQPSLRFYIPVNRRLYCLEMRDLREAFPWQSAHVIIRYELWGQIGHTGQVVFEGDEHVLLRGHQ